MMIILFCFESVVFLEEDEREIVAFVPAKRKKIENRIQVEQAQDYRVRKRMRGF